MNKNAFFKANTEYYLNVFILKIDEPQVEKLFLIHILHISFLSLNQKYANMYLYSMALVGLQCPVSTKLSQTGNSSCGIILQTNSKENFKNIIPEVKHDYGNNFSAQKVSLAKNFDLLIQVSLQPNVIYFRYFKLKILSNKII